MTDVWTSAGVLVGVGAVAVTDWERLDPIVAFVVAGNINPVGSPYSAQVRVRADGYGSTS